MSKRVIKTGTLQSRVGPLLLEWSNVGLRRISAGPLKTIESVQSGPEKHETEIAGAVPRFIQNQIDGFFRGEKIKLNEFDTEDWTDFQKKLYASLLKVSTGKTQTYSDLAKAMGHPGAARAVGTAMRNNPLPLLIPCHRVLPASAGTLGHYSFGSGPQMKARLLNFERWSGGETESLPPWWEFDWKVASRELMAHLPIRSRAAALRSRLRGADSLFLTLARSIVGQQIHGKAADAIWTRLSAAHRDETAFLRATLTELRTCGLSESKGRALQDLARASREGEVPNMGEAFFLSNHELFQRLTTVKGIGPWTVQMVLIFQLGRGDIWPVADFAVKRGAEKYYRARKPFSKQRLLQLGSQYAPFQTAASLFFWDYHGRHPELKK